MSTFSLPVPLGLSLPDSKGLENMVWDSFPPKSLLQWRPVMEVMMRRGRPGHRRVCECECAYLGLELGEWLGEKQQWQKHPLLWSLGVVHGEKSGQEINFYLPSLRGPAAKLGKEESSSWLHKVWSPGPAPSAGSLMQDLKHNSRPTDAESAL